LIEIALTLHQREGAQTAAASGNKRTTSHMTIAVIIAWIAVAMAYIMASTDGKKRDY